MGQRLVIHMMDDFDDEIANAYYHWSAYTSSSIYLLKQIANIWNLIQDEKAEEWTVTDYTSRVYHTDLNNLNDHELATILLYATGAGLTNLKESIKVLTENGEKRLRIPAISAIDRNEGLIELTERGIADSNDCSEGDIYIYIKSGEIRFEIISYFDFDTAKEYEYDLEKIKKMDPPIDLLEFNLKDIEKIEKVTKMLPLKTDTEIIDSVE